MHVSCVLLIFHVNLYLLYIYILNLISWVQSKSYRTAFPCVMCWICVFFCWFCCEVWFIVETVETYFSNVEYCRRTWSLHGISMIFLVSMDWFKGQFKGNPWKTPYFRKKSMVSLFFLYNIIIGLSLKPIHWWYFSPRPVHRCRNGGPLRLVEVRGNKAERQKAVELLLDTIEDGNGPKRGQNDGCFDPKMIGWYGLRWVFVVVVVAVVVLFMLDLVFSPPARWGLLDFIRAHARLLLRLLLLD